MRSGSRRQSGITYLAVLFFVAASGAMLAATATLWSHDRQREKEQELLWTGNQFRQAIALYYQRSPGALKRYPEKLEDLLEDRRYLTRQRYLRKIYRDPITANLKWGLVAAPQGGIMGVYSLSEGRPIKSGNFSEAEGSFSGAARYSDWRFLYEPPAAPIGAGLPSRRKQ